MENSMKTFQTKRAKDIFSDWGNETAQRYFGHFTTSFMMGDFGRAYEAYRALRDFIRQFCEERGIMFCTVSGTKHPEWCVYETIDNGDSAYHRMVGRPYKNTSGYSGYSLALLAGLKKVWRNPKRG